MPVAFREKGFRFYFFSNEGDPREPIHVHACNGDGEAKFWLYPEVTVASSAGYNRKQLARLVRVVEENRRQIERAWNEHFS